MSTRTQAEPGEKLTQVPIAEGLFTWPADNPELLGARCAACGAYSFPAQGVCPHCGSDDVAGTTLARSGLLWTWTSQEYLPKAPPYAGPETPGTFQKYYVGYVELADQLHVEARLVGFEDKQPEIGQEVRLAIVPFRTDENGVQTMTYVFERVGDEHA